MADRRILVDSSILIDFLRKHDKENSLLWQLKEKNKNLAISSISVFEIFAGAINAQRIKDAQNLVKWFEILDFDEGTAKLCGDLFIEMKSKNQLIDHRDLFIGASAIFHQMELATLNTKHFKRIPNIKIAK